tara:strand:+ start:76312 stop:76851 length:540 start_codon:yes stop_codon:yes gene_type:complete
MKRSETFEHACSGSPVFSCPLGKSEWIGKALRRLAVSPPADRAYRIKSEKIGSHPLHKKDVETGAGVDPFSTAERPTSKIPFHEEAGRLDFDVTTNRTCLFDWASPSSPFFFFRFSTVVGGRRHRRARGNQKKFADTVLTRHRKRHSNDFEKSSKSLIVERFKWCRLQESNPRPQDYKS